MIEIKNTLVSEDLLEKEFLCNISKCKGACCVEGDAGAPLSEEETRILGDVFEKVKPFLREEGVHAIENQGTSVIAHGEYETPLVDRKECAYVVFDKGVAQCGIEKAYEAGIIDYKKPISCHLYPVRITRYTSFEAVNYEHWPICNEACKLGAEMQLPVYRFLKDALTRNYGEEWYRELDNIAKSWKR